MSIADAERILVEFARPLVRPALMHLLWCHEFRVDLHEPLRPQRFWRCRDEACWSTGRHGNKVAYDGEVVTVVELHLVDGVLDLAYRGGGHGTKALRANWFSGGGVESGMVSLLSRSDERPPS